jgi:hypothetical protein
MVFPTLYDAAGREIFLVVDNQKNLIGYVREAFPTKTDNESARLWDGFYAGDFRTKTVATFKSKDGAHAAVIQEKIKRDAK